MSRLAPEPNFDPDADIWGSFWAWVPLFGNWIAVYHRTPPYRGPWVSMSMLAEMAQVPATNVRRALEKPHRMQDRIIEARPATARDLQRLRLRATCSTLVRAVGEPFPLHRALRRNA